MWTLLFFVLPCCSLAWAMFNMKGDSVVQRKLTLAASTMLVIVYMCLEYYFVHKGSFPNLCIMFVHDCVPTLVLPLLHLLVAYSLNVRGEMRYVRIGFRFTLLMIPDLLAAIFEPAGAGLAKMDSELNCMRFCIRDGWVYTLPMYCVAFIAQAILLYVRIARLHHIFVVRNLQLSRRGRWAVSGVSVACLFCIMLTLPTHSQMAQPYVMETVIVCISVFQTFQVYIMAQYFYEDVVVDQEQNPVNLETDHDSLLAIEIQRLIENDRVYCNCNLRVDDLAQMLSTNRTYVARVCRTRFGKTFTELMNYHRVEYAKQLMMDNPRKRMDDVAEESGFSSASFFSRVFKASVGLTPTQWRQQNHGDDVEKKALPDAPERESDGPKAFD